jgi:hypothetical protein
MGTLEAHDKAMPEEFCAFRAQQRSFFLMDFTSILLKVNEDFSWRCFSLQ